MVVGRATAFTVARAKRRGGSLASILRRVNEDDFGVLERFDLQFVLAGYRRAVAREDADAVDLDAALRRNQIAVALRTKLVGNGVAGLQGGAERGPRL